MTLDFWDDPEPVAIICAMCGRPTIPIVCGWFCSWICAGMDGWPRE